MRTFLTILAFTLIAVSRGPGTCSADTLEQITAEALRKNSELQAFEQGVTAAQGGVRTARTLQNPELTVAPGFRRIDEGRKTADLFHAEFGVSQLIKFPGKRALELAIAQRNVDLAKIALEGFRFQLRAKVRRAFYDGLAAEKIAETRTQQIESAKALVESAKKRAEAGYVSDFEGVKSQADLIAAKKALGEAELQHTTARVTLNTLMGRSPMTRLTFTGSFDKVRPRESLTDYLGLAMARNPAIRTQTRQVELAGLNLRATRLSRHPDVAVGPSIEYLDNEQTYGLGAAFALPLWDQKKGAIETATAEQKKAVAELEKTRAEVAAEVTRAGATLQTANEQLRLYSPAFLDQLKTLMAQAEQGYTQSATTLLIYLDAKRTYFDTLTDYYESLARVADTRSDLESAVGVPLEIKP